MALSKRGKIAIAIIVLIILIVVIGVLVHLFTSKSTVAVPSLELVPKPADGKSITDIEEKFYVKKITEALQPYRAASSVNRCGSGPEKSQTNCAPELDNFNPCTRDSGFSYNESKPCIFLKLRNVVNWNPEYLTDKSDAPKEMPEELKKNIEDIQKIWVSCEGKTNADNQNLGPVSVLPESSYGFTQSHFPITSTEEYAVPIIAIRFEQATRNVTVNVVCRAYAKNFPSGSITTEFPLFVGRNVKKET